MTVDIQATFGKKEKPRNGLENIIKDLVDDPMTPRYAIVRFFSPTTKRNNLEGGAETPVIRMDLIEPMISQAEIDKARRLLEHAYKARIGRLPDATLLGSKDGDSEDERDEDAEPSDRLPLDDDPDGDADVTEPQG